jgi:hypothetical protein
MAVICVSFPSSWWQVQLSGVKQSISRSHNNSSTRGRTLCNLGPKNRITSVDQRFRMVQRYVCIDQSVKQEKELVLTVRSTHSR